MKIGIFGGSFDPIHKGHIRVAKAAIEQLHLDKLMIVPTAQSPFKQTQTTETGQNRINMIKLVLPPRAAISLFEINRKGVSYTIKTVQHFQQQFPAAKLFLIIGSDLLENLDQWKKIHEIAALAQIVVFRRRAPFQKTHLKKYHAILLKNPLHDYSSTAFKQGYFDHVEASVMAYISANHLYLGALAIHALSVQRHAHSLATAQLAASLARAHNFDPKQAYLAGFLHDICKEWTNQEMEQFLAKHAFAYEALPKAILHQYVAYYWLKYDYKLRDTMILNAIKKHTTADFEMTRFEQLLYLADKLAEGRSFKTIVAERTLAHADLTLAFKRALKRSAATIKAKQGVIDARSAAIIAKWLV